MSCKYESGVPGGPNFAANPTAASRVTPAARLPVDASGATQSSSALRRRRRVRTLHALFGLVLSLNLLLVLVTGVCLQHRDALRLDERYVSRKFLPSGYRAGDGEAVRADIVLADLHSGRVFGAKGALLLDLAAAGWFVVLGSGIVLYGLRALRGNGERDNESAGAGNES